MGNAAEGEGPGMLGGVNTGAPLLDLSLLPLQGATEPQALAFLSNDAVML